MKTSTLDEIGRLSSFYCKTTCTCTYLTNESQTKSCEKQCFSQIIERKKNTCCMQTVHRVNALQGTSFYINLWSDLNIDISSGARTTIMRVQPITHADGNFTCCLHSAVDVPYSRKFSYCANIRIFRMKPRDTKIKTVNINILTVEILMSNFARAIEHVEVASKRWRL